MTAVSSSTTAPSKAPSVYHPQPEKCALRRLRRRRRALRCHRFGDRNLQAERRRSARLSCYVDGHDVELWEGTRQVAPYAQQPVCRELCRPHCLAFPLSPGTQRTDIVRPPPHVRKVPTGDIARALLWP